MLQVKKKFVHMGVQFALIQLGHELESLVDFLAQYPYGGYGLGQPCSGQLSVRFV